MSGRVPARPDAIVQLFDWPFRRVQAHLPTVAALGYGAIQVSPPQRSIDRPEWWARYQPVDHTELDGPLGDESDLRALCSAAAGLDPPITIVADVVLNHMAETRWMPDPPLHYPRFGPEHFHPQAPIDYRSVESIRVGWVGYGADLPDLRTESPYVRSEARAYLERLVRCGVGGFRIDAVKHIEPDYFADVLSGLSDQHSVRVGPTGSDGLLVYGEYVSQPGHLPVMQEYTAHVALMDFPLLETMTVAFAPGGDLRLLIDASAAGRALPVRDGLAFTTTHDIALDQYDGYVIPELVRPLAMAFVVTGDRRPVVYVDEHEHPVVRAALTVRTRSAGHWTSPVWASRRALVVRRGDCIVAINASDDPLPVVHAPVPGGAYEDLVSGAAWTVRAGRVSAAPVAPQSVALVVPRES